MLEQRVVEWTEQWKQEGLQEGRREGRARFTPLPEPQVVGGDEAALRPGTEEGGVRELGVELVRQVVDDEADPSAQPTQRPADQEQQDPCDQRQPRTHGHGRGPGPHVGLDQPFE